MSQSHKQALLYSKKAAQDEIVLDLMLPYVNVSDEIFGFHCQQASEKLLKAVLSEMSIRFRKTHDLKELIDLLMDNGKRLPEDLSDIDILTPYATLLRYEEISPSSHPLDRKKLRQLIANLRKWVSKEIGNPS